MENYEIKQAFKNLPDAGLPNNEPVMCREYEQCDGCNYPAHGFICWHGDGTQTGAFRAEGFNQPDLLLSGDHSHYGFF